MRNAEELKNLLRLLRQLICLWSFDTRRYAQVLRTLPKELRVLKLEELGQLEELAVRGLKSWAMRALKQRHWACVQASWA